MLRSVVIRTCDSRSGDGHAAPLPLCRVVMVKDRCCVPPPHGTVQSLNSPQSPSQSVSPQSLMSWQRAAELSTFSVVVVAEAIATETAWPPTVTSIAAAAPSAVTAAVAAAVAASAVAAAKLIENSTCAPKRYSC